MLPLRSARRRATPPRSSWLAFVAGTAAVVTASGCSLLYDLGADQCSSDADCRGSLAGRTCSAGLCVSPADPTGGAPAGGAGGDAGTGGASTGGTDGGGGGTGGAAECTTHQDCIEAHLTEPYLCRNGSCVALKATGCETVLMPDNLSVPDPIVIGAFTDVEVVPNLVKMNYELALKELTNEIGGLPGGADGSLRTVVAVVCDCCDASATAGSIAHLQPALDHLVTNLKVPGILATLYKSDLKLAYAYAEAQRGGATPLFLSPFAADSDLHTADRRGLLWHVLGDASDLAPAFVALIRAAETKLAPVEPLRLALIEADVAALTDIGGTIDTQLTFNGKSCADNFADGNYLRVRVESELTTVDPNLSAAVAALEAFRPNLVVAITGGEFTNGLLPVLEGLGADRPDFYVLGHYLAYRNSVLDAARNYPFIERRMAGINFAGALDPALTNAYLSRFRAEYPGVTKPEGYENFYDAAYYLLYALEGAGHVNELQGSDLARGMKRVADGTASLHFPVGPGQPMTDAFNTLELFPDDAIGIDGTLGPADFNLSTGARRATASAWCVAPDPELGFAFAYDQMRYDAAADTLTGDLSACGITGF